MIFFNIIIYSLALIGLFSLILFLCPPDNVNLYGGRSDKYAGKTDNR